MRRKGTGPASPRPQAARKSRGVQSTERLSPSIALGFLPSPTPGQPGDLGRVGTHPAAAERYMFSVPDTLSSFAGSIPQHRGELGDDLQARIARPSIAVSEDLGS
jgi:hypothetical protein